MTESVNPPPSSGSPEPADERLLGLVDGTIGGDEAAWEALWLALQPIIGKAARNPRWSSRLCRSEDDGDNVVLQVMGRLAADDFKALRAFRGRGGRAVRRWITSVAANACIDHVRTHPEYLGRSASNDGPKWAQRVEIQDGDDAELAGLGQYDAEQELEDHLVITALGLRLSALQREAIRLKYDDDASNAEIAEALGLADKEAAKRLVRSGTERMRARGAAADREDEAGQEAPPENKMGNRPRGP